MIQESEIKFLCQEHQVKPKTVRAFLEAGIPENEVADVIDMRNALCIYDFSGDFSEKGSIIWQISVEAMTKGYHAVGGDLDYLEAFVDKVRERVNSTYEAVRSTTRSPRRLVASLTSATWEVIDEIEESLSCLED